MVTILTRPDRPTADARALAIEQQRNHIFALEQIVADARDSLTRASAELDVALRARDRVIWELAQFAELVAPAE